MDPNSQNQTWSQWTFSIREAGKRPNYSAVELNAARWLRRGFGSVGRMRLRQTITGWIIEAFVEGAPVQDPAYVASVKAQFQTKFVESGFGHFASSTVRTKLLAGNPENGRARTQWVEMPTIRLQEDG